MAKSKKTRGAPRKKAKRRGPTKRASKKRKAPARKFATAWHRDRAQRAARRRREDVKQHGSLKAARDARRRRVQRDQEHARAERAAWRVAFEKRHGRPPVDIVALMEAEQRGRPLPHSSDEMDFTYTWRERYAKASPASRSASKKHRSVDPRTFERLCKVHRLTTSPNEGEAASARERRREMLAKHNLTEADLSDC